ncbi:MAG: short-chain dehydrogenase/reductase [Ilumatobacteraceae bacterium]|nr:short-chain dehydrogenase/reductase [Ilumatobacteraceae bacterium]
MATSVPFDLPAAQLEGKVAFITGASRGLGAGLAARLAEHGVQLGLCARHEPERPRGSEAITRAVDVTDVAHLERFADAVAETLGPIDLWINNAGIIDPMGPLRDLEPDHIQQALAVNIGGVITGTQIFIDRSADAPPSRRALINISSGAASSVYEGWSVYGASKAAVDQLTRVVAAEEPGLVCHSVAPGVVDTPMQTFIREQDAETFPAIDRFVDIHEQGAWNSPAWIADHLLGILAGTLAPGSVVYRVPDEPRT